MGAWQEARAGEIRWPPTADDDEARTAGAPAAVVADGARSRSVTTGAASHAVGLQPTASVTVVRIRAHPAAGAAGRREQLDRRTVLPRFTPSTASPPCTAGTTTTCD